MDLEERMRAALRTAMRERDRVATAALRSALGALGNATAIPSPPSSPAGSSTGASSAGASSAGAGGSGAAGSVHVAGAVLGVGAAEAPRRELTDADAVAILAAEIAERRGAAEQYGASPAADRLRAEADVLSGFLG